MRDRSLPCLRIQDRLAIDLPSVAGDDLGRLPFSLRILLENVLRHTKGEEREAHLIKHPSLRVQRQGDQSDFVELA
jgi:aconitase A